MTIPTMQELLTPSSARWRTGLDSLSWESVRLDIENGYAADVVFGYPIECRQGEILSNGGLAGWTPADFNEAKAMGLAIARICNLTPTWDCCSIADFEAGAINAIQLRQFCTGRNGRHPGTSTTYASFDNWGAVGHATRGVEPYWAWVADWPNYPSDTEIENIRAEVQAATRGVTRLGGIQYRSVQSINADLTVLIDSKWRP